jgi:hypothetical protein
VLCFTTLSIRRATVHSVDDRMTGADLVLMELTPLNLPGGTGDKDKDPHSAYSVSG